jgi:lysylphosphatidylglycerol synthetase-like protein (DUF2156 family)
MRKLFTIIALLIVLVLPSLAYASSTASEADACQGVAVISGNTSNSCDSPKASGSTIDGILSLVLNLFSAIVGLVAIIIIIVGGMQYVLSGGNSDKTNDAKNNILYAVIGLVIVALAQIIVRFVLHKASAL